MSQNIKDLWRIATAASGTLASSFALLATPVAEADQAMMPLDTPKTIRLAGQNTITHDDGTVQFDINAGNIGKFEFMLSKHIAVIFEGAQDPKRNCLYIRSDQREPTYTPLGNRAIQVSTQATPQEIEQVKKLGCIITDRPSVSKVLSTLR